MATGIWAINNYWPEFNNPESNSPTAIARLMTLTDIVVEQGTLESQQNTKGICRIEGYENKIIFILPEGTKVKKGDIVVKFDTAEVLKDITEQELEVQEAASNVAEAEQTVKVQENENASAIRQAEQEFMLAKLDLKKYIEGDFEVNKSDQEGAISEAQTNVDKAKRAYENMRALVQKGFRQFEQLREAEQVVKSAELRLKRDKKKYDMLINYEDVKSRAEFESKKVEAEFKLAAAKDTAEAKLNQANDALDYRKRRLKSRQERLERYQKNLERFEIVAPNSGTVAYPTENRFWGGEEIREGATVYQNQTVFNLPNMKKMQVNTGIHESLISKIKPGLPVTIKIDAFSGRPLKGIVTKVAPLAEANRFSSSKAYTTIATIEEIPDGMALKPGMNTQVEILAGRFPGVIGVPIQAVVSNAGKKFAYVKEGHAFERREVEVGRSNVSFVEITKGIAVGEVVALDAFQRGIKDFGDVQPEELLAEEKSDEPFDPDTVVAPEQPDEKGEDAEIGKTSDETAAADDPPRPRKMSEAQSDDVDSDQPPRPRKVAEENESGAEPIEPKTAEPETTPESDLDGPALEPALTLEGPTILDSPSTENQ